MRSPAPLLIAALLLAAVTTPATAQLNNWSAAACVGYGPKCWGALAYKSGLCFPNLWMSQQPPKCREAACLYCRQADRRYVSPVCRKDSIYKNCFGGNIPSRGAPRPKPASIPAPPPPRSGGACSYRGGGSKVVVPLTALKLVGQWSRVGSSIVFKKQGGTGIDPMGTNPVCARVVFPSSGVYYMTAISSAPHPTEHNDAWFKFSAGVNLYRPQSRTMRSGNSGWYKGYQNEGGNRVSNYLVTIDFNGHQFITKYVNAGQVYVVCVAGRSTKYAIQKIVFVKCQGGESCSRFTPGIKNAMANTTPSRCSR